VPDARPSGQIVFPTSSFNSYSWGAEATFIVRTDDVFDGLVPEQNITWNDDKDGKEIGHGFHFTTRKLSPGLHHIYAIIKDSQGGTRVTESITVQVVVQPPTVSISGPASGSTFGSDQFINFRGTAFDGAEGDLASKATWYLDGTPIGTGATLLKYRIPTEGTHKVTLFVANSMGASASASITVNIGPATGKPSVQITEPANGAFFGVNEPIKFTAAAEALGGATVPESGYVWSDDKDGALGIGKTITHTLSGGECVILEHHVTVTITDSFSRTATDTIIVNDGGLC
jgi:hypothetical protein